MSARIATARSFAEALAPGARWQPLPDGVFARVGDASVSMQRLASKFHNDTPLTFAVKARSHELRTNCTLDDAGLARAVRWLMFAASEDRRVAALVEKMGITTTGALRSLGIDIRDTPAAGGEVLDAS